MTTSIEITHTGEDYYDIKINGKEFTVNTLTGNIIKAQINSIARVLNNY